jgi:hypothetical protein
MDRPVVGRIWRYGQKEAGCHYECCHGTKTNCKLLVTVTVSVFGRCAVCDDFAYICNSNANLTGYIILVQLTIQ